MEYFPSPAGAAAPILRSPLVFVVYSAGKSSLCISSGLDVVSTFRANMSVAKIVELVGSSPNSWKEAAQNVNEAMKTIRGIHGIEVKDRSDHWKNKSISRSCQAFIWS
jgi:flavin-binding protein dodecin